MIRVIIFLLCLIPVGNLFLDLFFNRAGPDTAKYVMHDTGYWAFWMLIAALGMSPLRALSGLKIFQRIRRQIGLFAFFYASMHGASYMLFYLDFNLINLKSEILDRPYLLFGFLCWLLLLPLALTSNLYSQRFLGHIWAMIHKLVYLASLLACIHVALQVRSDAGLAIFFSLAVVVLLSWRVRRFLCRDGVFRILRR